MVKTSNNKRWETMDKGDVSLDKLMLQYEAFNRTEGKTSKTIEWYNQSLHLLNKFLKQNDYSSLLKDLSLEGRFKMHKSPLWTRSKNCKRKVRSTWQISWKPT